MTYIRNWYTFVGIKFDKTFKQKVLKVEFEMIEDAKKFIGFTLITYHSLVVSNSAVDKGRYKGSHVFEVRGRGDWVNTEGKTEQEYAKDADEENKRIQNYRFDLKSGVYYIANNLVYASLLEAGRSEQKPNGTYGPSQIQLEAALRKKFAEYNAKRYK